MCSCLVFATPFTEETVLSPLYILPSFVIDKLTIGLWVYLWAFYPVLLIYISVFLPVAYYIDYCSFVLQTDFYSSIFLSQEYFGYLGSFVFHKIFNFLL